MPIPSRAHIKPPFPGVCPRYSHRHECPPLHHDETDKENGDSSSTKGVCAAPSCTKAATMACPKCLALKVAAELGTLFCSQVRGREEGQELGKKMDQEHEK